MELLTDCLKAFAVGGALCAVGQILIDRTALTPARILTLYVVTGTVLGALGLYQPLIDWAGAGAAVPLTGVGNTRAKGVREALFSVAFVCIGLETDFKILLGRENRRSISTFLIAQSFNIVVTLVMALLLFGWLAG